MSLFATTARDIALTQEGVRETSRNRGPEVDEYVRAVHLAPEGQHAWCAAFVAWCCQSAAARLGVTNPLPLCAGALRLWQTAPAQFRRTVPEPGAIFVTAHGRGLGHVGFVVAWDGGPTCQTIEGNTNGGGSREGDGVYRRTRTLAEITVGYLVPEV